MAAEAALTLTLRGGAFRCSHQPARRRRLRLRCIALAQRFAAPVEGY